MPGLSYCISEAENKDLIQLILDDGGMFIPEINYPSEDYLMIRQYEDLSEFFNPSCKFLVLNQKYSTIPVEVRHVKNDEKEFWFVSLQSGGPTIEIDYSRFDSIENGYEIIPSDIYYAAKYWDWQNREFFKPPIEIAVSYNHFVKFIKHLTKPVKPKSWVNQRLWISKSFLEKAAIEQKKIILWEETIQDENGVLLA